MIVDLRFTITLVERSPGQLYILQVFAQLVINLKTGRYSMINVHVYVVIHFCDSI